MVDSNDRERVQESADELQKMVSGMGGVLLPKRALPKSGLPARGVLPGDGSDGGDKARGPFSYLERGKWPRT